MATTVITYPLGLGPLLRRALQKELLRLIAEYDAAQAGPRRRELAHRAAAIADLLDKQIGARP